MRFGFFHDGGQVRLSCQAHDPAMTHDRIGIGIVGQKLAQLCQPTA
jgi:hypothetical protein